MKRADPTTTTTAGAIPAVSSRRSRAASAVPADTSAARASIPLPADSTTGDPAVALSREYQELEVAAELVEARGDEVKRQLSARWGKWGGRKDTVARMATDPLFPELRRLNKESDAYTERLTNVIDRMEVVEPTTVAGLLAKVTMAIEIFPEPTFETQAHERFAMATFGDVARFLESSAEPPSEG